MDIRISLICANDEFCSFDDEVEDMFNIKFNFSAPDEHVGDVEQENRTLKERIRAEYHHLPFKVIPRKMIRALILWHIAVSTGGYL